MNTTPVGQPRSVIPALWATKKFFSTPFLPNGTTIIDLRKAGMTNEYISRLIIRVVGSVNAGSATAGTVTGNDNPEGLLTNLVLQVAPSPGSLVPMNQVSGRGLRWVKAINRERFVDYAPITDGAGAQTVLWDYEIIFKRNHVRKSVEYGLDMSKYSSVVVNATFGGQTVLYSGSPNTWNFSGLTLELWADVGYNVTPDGLHATETFEQVFPITANGDLLINQLPAGVLYTDLFLLAEHNNVGTDGIVNNVDIEGGNRNWTYPGDNNASFIENILSLDCFDGSVATADTNFNSSSTTGTQNDLIAGAYLFRMRDGTFLRSIDARESQILIKVNVTGWTNSGTYNLRLIGKKLVPYGVMAKAASNAGTKVATGKR